MVGLGVLANAGYKRALKELLGSPAPHRLSNSYPATHIVSPMPSSFTNRSPNQRRTTGRLYATTSTTPLLGSLNANTPDHSHDNAQHRFVGRENQPPPRASTYTIPYYFPPRSPAEVVFPVMRRGVPHTVADNVILSWLENFRGITMQVR